MSDKIKLPYGLKADGKVYRYVTVRGITGAEQDFLTDSKLIKKNQHVGKVLSACIESIETESGDQLPSPASHVDDLISSDRFFLLVEIRKASLGSKYVFSLKCADKNCEHKSDFSLDLENIDCSYAKDEDVEMRFNLTLPDSGKEAVVKVLDGYDEAELFDILEKRQSSFATSTLKLSVVSLDGERPTTQDLKKLTIKDINYIRKFLDRVDYGLDQYVEFNCEACGKEYKEMLPATEGVFFTQQLSEDDFSKK